MSAAEMHMFICVHFLPHANPSRQTSRQKVKKCIHYIYTKYPFFIFKKCIHYIYTRNHISSRQQYFQRPSHYSPTPQICRQQAEIGQITTNHYCPSNPHAYPHFAGSRIKYITQQIQATSATTTTRQKGTHLLRRRHTHIFSPIFPASFKTADREHTSDRRRKKREKGVRKGVKRYKKV